MLTKNNSRLDVVLRAGQANLEATHTGAKPPFNKGASVPNRQAPKPPAAIKRAGTSMVSVKTGGGKAPPPPAAAPAPGKSPKLPPAPADFGNKSSSMEVKDLVNAYNNATEKRRSELEAVRKSAEKCDADRVTAVTNYRNHQEEAASIAIKSLQDKLVLLSAEIDKMQSASKKTMAELGTMKDQDGASSSKVMLLTKAVEQKTNENAALTRELAAKEQSCNSARDKTAREAAAALTEAKAETDRLLTELKKKTIDGDVKSAKDLEAMAEKYKKATADLASEGVKMTELKKEKREEKENFAKAAKAACKALDEYAKWFSSEV